MKVRVHIKSDQEDRAELAEQLARELTATDVATVRREKAGAFEWVNLVITSVGVLPTLVTALEVWARRHPDAAVSLEAEGEHLDVDAPDAERTAWIRRVRTTRPLQPRRALLIGSGEYTDERLARLAAPSADVDALAAVLEDPAIGDFDAETVVGEPSHELCRRLDHFFTGRHVKHGDVLLLYVSGHGIRSERGTFYFAAANTDLEAPRATAIPGEFVKELVSASYAGTIILIFDCCHSGAFAEGLTPRSTVEVHPELVASGKGRVAITASTALEYAFEERAIRRLGRPAATSLFTRSLVAGLRSGEADHDEDGQISVDELYAHVCDELRAAAVPQAPGIAPAHSGVTIARSGRGAAPLPSWLSELIEHDERDKRLAAVTPLRELAVGSDARVGSTARAALQRLAEDDDSERVREAAAGALGDREPPPPPPPPRVPWRLVAAIAAALAATAVLIVLLVGGGDKDKAVAYDFDGDGRQEIVMSVFDATEVPEEARPGEVLIHAGPDATGPTPVRQDFPVDETLDDFGRGIASADFNGDGHADLAVSTPSEQLVALRYGSDDGLPEASSDTIDGDQVDLADAERLYGWSLAAADLDRDGYAELLIGAPDTPDGGAVQIFRGSADGLDRIRPDRRVTLAAPAGMTAFGARLRVGDIDGSGGLDLVEGAPDDVVAGHLTTCLDVLARQRCEAIDQSGGGGASSIAVADVDADGFDDVVQGDPLVVAPTRQARKRGTPGELRIWRGGAAGTAGTPERVTERSLGQPSAAAHEFGAGTDAADLDGEPGAEIVTGAPGADRVFTIRREDGRYRARVLTSPERPQDFGFGLALLDVTDAAPPDLVVVARPDDAENAVRVVPNVAASDELLPLPGLAGAIELNRLTLIALGRRAGG
jgi:hypothetical protein